MHTHAPRSARKILMTVVPCSLALISCLACSARLRPSAENPAASMVAANRAVAPAPMYEQMMPEMSREQYEHIKERGFVRSDSEPLSTFAIDVDTASYSNVRRFITDGVPVPPDAVRIEELINYFEYDYPRPDGDAPVAVYSEVGPCPWNDAHELLHVGLRARGADEGRTPARNLVFLLDVSGSMDEPTKLPLLKQAFATLVEGLSAQDRVAIVVYAGSEGLVLPSTSGRNHETIMDALDRLSAGGSTNGGAGIQLAYAQAREHFVEGGINRVILATDGDFNVGVTSQGDLVRMIEKERDSGVFLTVLGFGSGNLQDHTMESLADHGNGNYAYIDSLREAQKVLGREAASTLVTVAKDVKVQVEFNPREIAEYRLVGYENRALNAEDFANDRKDAGELGVDDTVTALYEVVRARGDERAQRLRYQGGRELTARAGSDELATIAVRYQEPRGGSSKLIETPVRGEASELEQTSQTFRFAAAVAGFGMVLRDSEHAGDASLRSMRALAASALGHDLHGDRTELLSLMDRARTSQRR